MPVYASAQNPERITILDNFGDYDKGEPLFIFGQVATLSNDSFLVMQIVNPQGDLCQIQQLLPLPNGAFITDVIPLKGRICGITGEYEIKLFYGDYSTSTTFSVSSNSFSESTDDQKITAAQNLISEHTSVINDLFETSLPVQNQTTDSLSVLDSAYVDLWDEFFTDDLLLEVDPLIRSAVSSSLDSVERLLDKDEVSFDVAKSIDRMIFASIFYYEIGDVTKSVDLLTDVFVDIRNINPQKITPQKTSSFDDLEETLLNLMKKSDTVMSKSVKTEVGFIFARGTAPIYANDISELIDVLSKARYLDVVSRKQSDLYRLVQNDWDFLKTSLQGKESIEEFN